MIDDPNLHPRRRDELMRVVIKRDMRRYRWWARYWSVVLLFGWAVWIVALKPFELSMSYSTFAVAGEHVTAFVVGGLAIVSGLCTIPRKDHKWWLAASMIIQGAILAGIAATFAYSSPTSTGVWVYGVLSLAASVGALDISLLPPLPPSQKHG